MFGFTNVHIFDTEKEGVYSVRFYYCHRSLSGDKAIGGTASAFMIDMKLDIENADRIYNIYFKQSDFDEILERARFRLGPEVPYYMGNKVLIMKDNNGEIEPVDAVEDEDFYFAFTRFTFAYSFQAKTYVFIFSKPSAYIKDADSQDECFVQSINDNVKRRIAEAVTTSIQDLLPGATADFADIGPCGGIGLAISGLPAGNDVSIYPTYHDAFKGDIIKTVQRATHDSLKLALYE